MLICCRNGNLEVSIVAPFYDDPAPPGGQPGQPYFKLWDYEVHTALFIKNRRFRSVHPSMELTGTKGITLEIKAFFSEGC